ncbi:hypothetical protein OHW73_18030 [Acinetobacter baumannii]|nr:hypothetical protein [Acinetobacter baumannii]
MQVIHNNVDEPYASMECIFVYYIGPENGFVTVGEKFSYQINGEVKSEYLVYDGLMVSNLVNKLHNIMTAHTGSNWKEFILSLDEKGRAHTKFIYDES